MIPMLIKRCLTFGVKILPHELSGILKRYEKSKIPDEVLAKMTEVDLKEYVRALYLCSCEMAGDWQRGMEIIKKFGFTEERLEVGHRVFLSLKYNQTDSEVVP
jgi:hypothetical protein